jgi:hypothetical protein
MWNAYQGRVGQMQQQQNSLTMQGNAMTWQNEVGQVNRRNAILDQAGMEKYRMALQAYYRGR